MTLKKINMRNNYNNLRNKSSYNRVPLDLKNPRVLELSEKYNISVKAVAYIRAAINGGQYTKERLITHIEDSIKVRYDAIEEHKTDPRLTDARRSKLIEYTQNNIDFRNNVIVILNRLTDYELHDILR